MIQLITFIFIDATVVVDSFVPIRIILDVVQTPEDPQLLSPILDNAVS